MSSEDEKKAALRKQAIEHTQALICQWSLAVDYLNFGLERALDGQLEEASYFVNLGIAVMESDGTEIDFAEPPPPKSEMH